MVHTIDTTSPPSAATTDPDPAGSRRPRGQISPEAVALLRMAQAGDRDAFAQIYRSYASNVRAYVATRMRERDRDAVDDLVQDTFCAALDELDRAHDDVCGWLIQLAAKMCTRHSWILRTTKIIDGNACRSRLQRYETWPPDPGRSIVRAAKASRIARKAILRGSLRLDSGWSTTWIASVALPVWTSRAATAMA